MIATPNPRVFLSAGEASGDHYGAEIIAGLRARFPEASFVGLGGTAMEAAGQTRVVRAEDVAHMGLTEVVRHAPYIWSEYWKLVGAIRRDRPDVAILIDFPDVNLRLAWHLHLDANGTWYDVPGQGPVWQPELAVDDSGFDPYGYGSWVQYPGVGYLWASGYGWGWTPYRCGNWSYFGGFGWGWAPGAGCGAFGWGFFGGGQPVNIAVFPNGYRPIRVPVPGRGPERPLIPVHTFRPLPTARPVQQGPRRIAGLTATPIAPLHANSNSGGVATGSSLRRDYPVDSKTHAPVLGLA